MFLWRPLRNELPCEERESDGFPSLAMITKSKTSSWPVPAPPDDYNSLTECTRNVGIYKRKGSTFISDGRLALPLLHCSPVSWIAHFPFDVFIFMSINLCINWCHCLGGEGKGQMTIEQERMWESRRARPEPSDLSLGFLQHLHDALRKPLYWNVSV